MRLCMTPKFIITIVFNPLILAFSLREKEFKPLSQCHSDRRAFISTLITCLNIGTRLYISPVATLVAARMSINGTDLTWIKDPARHRNKFIGGEIGIRQRLCSFRKNSIVRNAGNSSPIRWSGICADSMRPYQRISRPRCHCRPVFILKSHMHQ
jgi:hypothetical protein